MLSNANCAERVDFPLSCAISCEHEFKVVVNFDLKMLLFCVGWVDGKEARYYLQSEEL